MASGFRGTSVDQDGRWGKAEEKLLQQMEKEGKFAPILNTKVNLKKVNLSVISKWITKRITEIVEMEDEILIGTIINTLQAPEVHGKRLQIQLTAFLNKKAAGFVTELWTLLVDAQNHPKGVPMALIEEKKQEILARESQTLAAIQTIRPGQAPAPSSESTSTSRQPPGSPVGKLRAASRLESRGDGTKSEASAAERPRDRSVSRSASRMRAESRSARVHRDAAGGRREYAAEGEDDGERVRARSRRHGLDEREQPRGGTGDRDRGDRDRGDRGDRDRERDRDRGDRDRERDRGGREGDRRERDRADRGREDRDKDRKRAERRARSPSPNSERPAMKPRVL